MGKQVEPISRQEPDDSSAALGFLRDLGQMELKLVAVHKKEGGQWRSEKDGDPYFSWLGEAESGPEGKNYYLMVGLKETAEGKIVHIGLYTSRVRDSEGGEAALAAGYNIDKGEFVSGIAVRAGRANMCYLPAPAEQENFRGVIAALIPHMSYGGVDAHSRVRAPQGVDVSGRFSEFMGELKNAFEGENQKSDSHELPQPKKMDEGQG